MFHLPGKPTDTSKTSSDGASCFKDRCQRRRLAAQLSPPSGMDTTPGKEEGHSGSLATPAIPNAKPKNRKKSVFMINVRDDLLGTAGASDARSEATSTQSDSGGEVDRSDRLISFAECSIWLQMISSTSPIQEIDTSLKVCVLQNRFHTKLRYRYQADCQES